VAYSSLLDRTVASVNVNALNGGIVIGDCQCCAVRHYAGLRSSTNVMYVRS